MLKDLLIVKLETGEKRRIDLGKLTREEVQRIMDESDGGALFIFMADQPLAKVVVLCPGGGFKQLNLKHEGGDFAEWFAEHGYSLAVLKYRLPNGDRNLPLDDVTAACKLMRSGIDGTSFHTIGCMGASIGGYLAAYVANRGLIDFQINLYAVFTMEDDFAHQGCKQRMFGESLKAGEEIDYSLQYQVIAQTAPAFIVASEDDPAVNPMNSFLYAQALLKNKVPFTFHIYPNGGHSFGFKDSYPYKQNFLNELAAWLKSF